MNTYECRRCSKALTIDNFHLDTIKKRGHVTICKVCKALDRDVMKEMLANAKKRAKKKGWKFDLTLQFLRQLNEKQDGICIYTGVKLNWKVSPKKQRVCPIDRASLDRLDSAKGYTQDNVQFITDFANRIKYYYSENEMVRFCKLIVERTKF